MPDAARATVLGTAGVLALHAWNDIDMNAIPGYDWSPTGHLEFFTPALLDWGDGTTEPFSSISLTWTSGSKKRFLELPLGAA